jgi:hypothetical protein
VKTSGIRIAPGFVVALGLLLVVVELGFGQIYPIEVRPPALSYRVARTDHFDLIYQSGYEAEAAEVGAVLEHSYLDANALTGTRRRLRVPVVLDAYNDRSNGFVTPFPFRMELEIPPLRGNGLSPRHPSWLNTVARHELVHAAHAESGSGFGLVGLVRLLSPDMARSLNLMVPAGIAEGVAVHLESQGEHRPGRMNHSFFTMEFRAAIAADRPWSLAQMLERPRYSLPGDRFYHGGSYLYRYLYERDEGETFRRAQRLHYVMPMFGYGVSLWYGARRPPWIVGRDFRLDARQAELERQVRLGQITEARAVAGGRGNVHRRPQWLTDTQVVTYATGYYTRPGFYRFDVDTGSSRRISAERITEDALFSLSSDRSHLTFSRYHVDPVIPGRRIAEAHRLDVSTGVAKRLTRDGHVFSVAANRHEEVWGVVTSGQYSRLATIDANVTLPLVPLRSRSVVKMMAWSPTGDTLAALVNRDGYQGVQLIYRKGRDFVVEPLILSREFSVLDLSWFPDGRRLMFTADTGDVPNLFVYDLEANSVSRITNARYGAFEGSVSPDGSRVAFVEYQHESWRLAVAELSQLDWRPVPSDMFAAIDLFEDPPVATSITPETVDALPSTSYKAFRYLSPRGFLPIFDYDLTPRNAGDIDLGFGIGAAVTGADPLQQWSYVGGAYYQANDLWGQFSMASGRSILRPTLSVFRTPSTRLAQTETGIRRVGWEEQGTRMALTLPVTLASNVYRSTLLFSVSGELSRARFFDTGGAALTPFSRRASLTPTLLLGLGLHATGRDLRFSRGVSLGATSTIDAWSDADRRQAMRAEVRVFTRSIPGTGGSFSLIGGLLWQNRPSVYNLDFFLPRGLEDTYLGSGSFLKFGADVIQPLLYVDNGLIILPVFLKAIYAYGFAESVKSTSSLSFDFDSVGGGIGFQLRVLHTFSLEMRFGAAYRPDSGEVDVVFR